MFLKYAMATILGAEVATRDAFGLVKSAHRAVFNYEPRPGYLYVRSRMISSRCNDNHDEFPAEEIRKAWRTAIGKPAFVNHHNEDHRRMRGVIIDAALHEDTLPDGRPDVWIEALHEVDAKRFPRLAQAILSGRVNRTSMGCDVGYSICSACGNKATNPAEYCEHIPRMKGKVLYRHTASGQREGHLIRETCYKLSFFENSFLVEDPADPTAVVTGVDDRGLTVSAARKTAAPKGLRFVFTPAEEGTSRSEHRLSATMPNQGGAHEEVGYLHWSPGDGMIGMIKTDPQYARQGVANALWQRAHEVANEHGLTPPRHSDVQTPDGSAWAQSVDQHPTVMPGQQPLFPVPEGHEIRSGLGAPVHDDLHQHLIHEHEMEPGWMDIAKSKGADFDEIHAMRHRYDIGTAHEHAPARGLRRNASMNRGEPFRIQRKRGKWLVLDAEGKTRGAHASRRDALRHRATLYSSLPQAGDVNGNRNPERTIDSPTEIVRARTVTSMRKGAPFAGYEDFDECVERNADKDDPEAYCGEIKHRAEGRLRTLGEIVVHAETHPEAACPSCGGKNFIASDSREADDPEIGKYYQQLGNMGVCQDCGDVFDATKSFTQNRANREFAQIKENDLQRRRKEGDELWQHVTPSKTFDHLDRPETMREKLTELDRADMLKGMVGNGLDPSRPLDKKQIEYRTERALTHSRPLDLPQGPVERRHLSSLPSALAYGETRAPADVDTLRTESCPVCGEADSFDGDRCEVCHFLQPPAMFTDPDTSVARQMDLEKQQFDQGMVGPDGQPMPGIEQQEQAGAMEGLPGQPGDQIADLFCPACGFSADTQAPMTNDDPAMPSQQQGLMEGDVCPQCGNATMLSPNDVGALGGEVPQEVADDADANGIPDEEQQGPDTDADGVPDGAEPDADGDAVPDDAEPDDDQDGVPDDADPDPQDPADPGEEEDSESDAVEQDEGPQKGRKDEDTRRAASRGHGRKYMSKPQQRATGASSKIARLEQIVAAQGAMLEVAGQQLHYLATLAGVAPEFEAIKREGAKKIADIMNPAQPVPDPAGGAPTETTEQAEAPQTYDDPRNPGLTPGSVNGVPAQMTDTPLAPGATLPTAPFTQLVDPTQPVAGTETHVPLEQTKIETDVRVGDPMANAGNPQGYAFPLTGEFAQEGAAFAGQTTSPGYQQGADGARTMASIRLARLRTQAGLGDGRDELVVAAEIEKNAALSDPMIAHEIATLTAVAAKTARPAGRRPQGGSLPKAARAERRVPSLAPEPAQPGLSAVAGFAEDDASDLFLDAI